jgi:hypothetical protein
MHKHEKLTPLQELERNKRIPERTQAILQRMILRRHAELCESPARHRSTTGEGSQQR